MILITQIRLIEGSNDADLYLSRESNKYFNGANLLASTFQSESNISLQTEGGGGGGGG